MGKLRPHYITILEKHLNLKKEKNSSYSLRGFANYLGVDSAALSRFLAGKAIPSLKIAAVIVRALKLGDEERSLFLNSVADEQKCAGLAKVALDLTDCEGES